MSSLPGRYLLNGMRCLKEIRGLRLPRVVLIYKAYARWLYSNKPQGIKELAVVIRVLRTEVKVGVLGDVWRGE